MLLHIDSKQEVKWATVLFPPDIDDIIYCSVWHFYGVRPKIVFLQESLELTYCLCIFHADQRQASIQIRSSTFLELKTSL